jgi:ATP-dependent Clp protease ATP-binding subunit ClpA
MDVAFSAAARRVLQRAADEAQRLNHDHLGTEHLLLALLHEETGAAAAALAGRGLELRRVRLEVEQVIRGPTMPVTRKKLPPTPRAQRVFDYAVEEARNLGHAEVGAEHLLLGLLREPEGIAAQVFMGFGVYPLTLRTQLLAIIGIDEAPTVNVAEWWAPLRQTVQNLNRQISQLRWDQEDALANRQLQRAAAVQAEIMKLETDKQTILARHRSDERIQELP